MEIFAGEDEHKAVFQALANILKPYIGRLDYSILTGDAKSFADVGWVDKIPTPVLSEFIEPLTEVLDVHTSDTDLGYSWQLLRNHLPACHGNPPQN